MGFLNHATNNIIIDAVLTERGRELLASNNGSFNISSFSFGDDEIDYSIIKKYGLTIGKEKIIKNTPIFEANPNENIAIKHSLISFPNPLLRITQIPTLSWTNVSSGESLINLYDTKALDGSNIGVTKYIEIKNKITVASASESVDENITDSILFVKMHGSLLKIANQVPVDTDTNGIDTYTISAGAAPDSEFTNQIMGSFTVYSNGIVSASDFTKFASISKSDKINTSIQVIGMSSGATTVIPVVITKRPAS
jgi:hypothetical protein